MKLKGILIAVLVGFSSTAVGQVTYEATYTEENGKMFQALINLGNDSYKYLLVDRYNDQFSLYNLDHSPYMENVPTGVSLDSGNYVIAYISTDLFDCDTSNIEYAIMRPLGAPANFYVYRTDGTLLWQKDSVKARYIIGSFNNGSFMIKPIVNSPLGARLFLMDLSPGHEGEHHVYSLCGSLPTSIEEMSLEGDLVEVFPNPSSELVTFRINPPDNVKLYELLIFNSAMQVIKSERLEGNKDIDVRGLSSGVYYYSLKTSETVRQTGKFIVTR